MRVTEDLAQAVLEHEREADGEVSDELAVATGKP
jgi:hypothetical protein